MVDQLACAYYAIYGDSVADVRLEQTKVSKEGISSNPLVTPTRRTSFISSLHYYTYSELNDDYVGLAGSDRRLGGTQNSEAEQLAAEGSSDENIDDVHRLEDLMQVKLSETSTWLKHSTTTLCEHFRVCIPNIVEPPDEEAREASEAGEEGLNSSGLTGSIRIAKAALPTRRRSKHVEKDLHRESKSAVTESTSWSGIAPMRSKQDDASCFPNKGHWAKQC